jgi:branched-chain amino acid transport system permease protein
LIGGAYSTPYRREQRLVRTTAMRIWVVLLIAILGYLPWVVAQRSLFGVSISRHALLNMNLTQVNVALIVMVGALALNLLTGFTGLISIGNAGFFALGAIVAATLGGLKPGWPSLPFPLVVLAAGLVGAFVGALVGLPSLRIRGIYLLLATMGLHFVMVFLFVKYQLRWFGYDGIQYTKQASLFGFDLSTDIRWFYFLLGCVVVAFLLTRNLLRTRQGRAFVAVRDHPIAAAMAGVHVARIRVTSFAVSSFMTTAIGAVYVWYLGAASESNFTLLFAIQFIAMIVIGGEGSLLGTVLGALLYALIPNALVAISEMGSGVPVLNHTLANWQSQITNIIFGTLILVVIVFSPSGLAGLWVRVKRRLVRQGAEA